MTDALRPSELFALRWKCFEPETSRLVILETVYRGKIRPWGKTKKSLEPVPLPALLITDFEAWKAKCPDASPEAFIFANEEGGFNLALHGIVTPGQAGVAAVLASMASASMNLPMVQQQQETRPAIRELMVSSAIQIAIGVAVLILQENVFPGL